MHLNSSYIYLNCIFYLIKIDDYLVGLSGTSSSTGEKYSPRGLTTSSQIHPTSCSAIASILSRSRDSSFRLNIYNLQIIERYLIRRVGDNNCALNNNGNVFIITYHNIVLCKLFMSPIPHVIANIVCT